MMQMIQMSMPLVTKRSSDSAKMQSVVSTTCSHSMYNMIWYGMIWCPYDSLFDSIRFDSTSSLSANWQDQKRSIAAAITSNKYCTYSFRKPFVIKTQHACGEILTSSHSTDWVTIVKGRVFSRWWRIIYTIFKDISLKLVPPKWNGSLTRGTTPKLPLRTTPSSIASKRLLMATPTILFLLYNFPFPIYPITTDWFLRRKVAVRDFISTTTCRTNGEAKKSLL